MIDEIDKDRNSFNNGNIKFPVHPDNHLSPLFDIIQMTRQSPC